MVWDISTSGGLWALPALSLDIVNNSDVAGLRNRSLVLVDTIVKDHQFW